MNRPCPLVGILSIACLLCNVEHPSAAAASKGSPKVDQMISDGVAYLESNYQSKTNYGFQTVADAGFGEHALVGYAHFKAVHDETSPVVRQGLQAAQKYASLLGSPDSGGHNSKTMYTASICAILLAEVDPEGYRSELQKYAKFLRARQYHNGAFGYFNSHEGDVSQTQYVMLALWALERRGINIDYSIVPDTLRWLLAVQDREGGWPYQGALPPGGSGLISQTGVTPSMAVAGGSAALIGGDILRLWGDYSDASKTGIDGLPQAIRISMEISRTPVRRPSFASDSLISSIQLSESYLSENSRNVSEKVSKYPYYQLYTLERYESFRALAESRESDDDEPWFQSGIQYLTERQDVDGGWTKNAYGTMRGLTSTSFALLFLLRSTKSSIAALKAGTAVGGWGLPEDTQRCEN